MSAVEVDVVERQLAAYNAHDLAAFISCYAEAVSIYRLPALEATLTGRHALSEFYRTQRFNLPGLHANIVTRITLGNKVIDHEEIHGLKPNEVVEVVAVYEIRDALIQAVWFHSPV